MNRSQQQEGILTEKQINFSLPSMIESNSHESKTSTADRRMSLTKAYSCSDASDYPFGSSLFITPKQVAEQMLSNSHHLLSIVDCRSQMDFSSEHLRSSHNVNCRAKLIARKLNSKRLDEIEPSLSRSFHHSDTVVLYDQSTENLSEEEIRNLPIYLVVQAAKRSNKKVHIIQGGLEAMKREYPQLIEYAVQMFPDDENRWDIPPTPDHIDKENFVMTEILPHIFVGNLADSQNRERLATHAISHVINATPDLPFCPDRNCRELRIEIYDLPSENILQHFEGVTQFIDEALQSRSNNVLVHCSAGISRSPTLVLAYMIKKRNFSLDNALKQMRESRSIIDPNFSFILQLRSWEKKCRSNSTEMSDENRHINAGAMHFPNSSRPRPSSQYCGSTSTGKNESKPRSDPPITVT